MVTGSFTVTLKVQLTVPQLFVAVAVISVVVPATNDIWECYHHRRMGPDRNR